jgi:hypothetical protein
MILDGLSREQDEPLDLKRNEDRDLRAGSDLAESGFSREAE